MKSIRLEELHLKNNLFEMRGMENILGLKYPQIYSCEIKTYHSDYRQMSIRIFETPDVLAQARYFYLDLLMVSHFNGFVNWQGSNFRLLNIEDMQKIPIFKDTKDGIPFVIQLADNQFYHVTISAIKFVLSFDTYIPLFEEGIILP